MHRSVLKRCTAIVAVVVMVTACGNDAALTRPPSVAASGPSVTTTSASTAPTRAVTPSSSTAAIGPTATPMPAGRIAFGTYDPAVGDFLIYTASPDGTDVKQLLPGGHESPVWAPDSTQIAVDGGADGGFATIVGADGSNPRVLKLTDRTLGLGVAAWSPDGVRFAGEGWDDTKPGREGIYLVNASDGRDLTRLTSPTGGVHDIPGSFSPDGRDIVFVHATDDAHERGELWLVDVDGSNAQKLGEQPVAYGTAFSPDGRWIAAASGSAVLIFDVADLAAAAKSIELPAGYASNAARWSPDGTRFVLGLYQPGRSRPNIYTMKIDGTDVSRLTSTAQESSFGTWGLPPL